MPNCYASFRYICAIKFDISTVNQTRSLGKLSSANVFSESRCFLACIKMVRLHVSVSVVAKLICYLEGCRVPMAGAQQITSKSFTTSNTSPVTCVWLVLAQWRHMNTWMSVDIGSSNSMLPVGTKPLYEPILINHVWGPLTITWGQW